MRSLTPMGSPTPMLTSQSPYDLVFSLMSQQSCRPRTKAHPPPHIPPSLPTTLAPYCRGPRVPHSSENALLILRREPVLAGPTCPYDSLAEMCLP